MTDPMTEQQRRDAEFRIELQEDRPASGMWHCGPNAAWVTVTHLPTMISARAFDQSHHYAKQSAMACCEMMVEQSRLLKCQFPDRLQSAQAERERIVAGLEALYDDGTSIDGLLHRGELRAAIQASHHQAHTNSGENDG